MLQSGISFSTYVLNASSNLDFPLRLTPVTTLISGVPSTLINLFKYCRRSISFMYTHPLYILCAYYIVYISQYQSFFNFG